MISGRVDGSAHFAPMTVRYVRKRESEMPNVDCICFALAVWFISLDSFASPPRRSLKFAVLLLSRGDTSNRVLSRLVSDDDTFLRLSAEIGESPGLSDATNSDGVFEFLRMAADGVIEEPSMLA